MASKKTWSTVLNEGTHRRNDKEYEVTIQKDKEGKPFLQPLPLTEEEILDFAAAGRVKETDYPLEEWRQERREAYLEAEAEKKSVTTGGNTEPEKPIEIPGIGTVKKAVEETGVEEKVIRAAIKDETIAFTKRGPAYIVNFYEVEAKLKTADEDED